MTSSGPFSDEPYQLSDQERTYYLGMRETHANHPDTGKCPVCELDTCCEYLFARGVLLSGGVQ